MDDNRWQLTTVDQNMATTVQRTAIRFNFVAYGPLQSGSVTVISHTVCKFCSLWWFKCIKLFISANSVNIISLYFIAVDCISYWRGVRDVGYQWFVCYWCSCSRTFSESCWHNTLLSCHGDTWRSGEFEVWASYMTNNNSIRLIERPFNFASAPCLAIDSTLTMVSSYNFRFRSFLCFIFHIRFLVRPEAIACGSGLKFYCRCFFLFQRKVSEMHWPIGAKFCTVVSTRPNFIMPVQNFGRPSPKKY